MTWKTRRDRQKEKTQTSEPDAASTTTPASQTPLPVKDSVREAAPEPLEAQDEPTSFIFDLSGNAFKTEEKPPPAASDFAASDFQEMPLTPVFLDVPPVASPPAPEMPAAEPSFAEPPATMPTLEAEALPPPAAPPQEDSAPEDTAEPSLSILPGGDDMMAIPLPPPSLAEEPETPILSSVIPPPVSDAAPGLPEPTPEPEATPEPDDDGFAMPSAARPYEAPAAVEAPVEMQAPVAEAPAPMTEPPIEDAPDFAAPSFVDVPDVPALTDAPEMPAFEPEMPAVAMPVLTTAPLAPSGIPRVAPFIVDAPPPDEPVRIHSLVVRVGKLSAAFPLTKDVTTIGRPDSATQNYPDIEIDLDDAVSRRHAEIVRRGSEFCVVDVGSANGTRLNGEMLPPNQEVTLAPGDRIHVGERTEIVFE